MWHAAPADAQVARQLQEAAAKRLHRAVDSVLSSPQLLRNGTALDVAAVCAALDRSFAEIGLNGVLLVLHREGWALALTLATTLATTLNLPHLSPATLHPRRHPSPSPAPSQ